MTLAVETVVLDLPALVARFGRRLHEAGVPVTPERSARFAQALDAGPAGLAAAAVLDRARGAGLRPRAGAGVRRGLRRGVRRRASTWPIRTEGEGAHEAAPEDERAAAASRRRRGGVESSGGGAERHRAAPRATQTVELAVPVAASDEERLRRKRFDALEPGELVAAVPADDAAADRDADRG